MLLYSYKCSKIQKNSDFVTVKRMLKVRQSSISYMLIRGGSSKGIYFLKDDLPLNERQRDEMILDIVGRDIRQIDGIGGAHPLTSKVAIVSKSTHEKADIDFLFVQVVVGENRVDTTPNCGNILAGVGVFAIESGLIKADKNTTSIKINMINSQKICELIMQTPQGVLTYEGDTKIDGVLGTSAPITCNYMDIAGSLCGVLFPTGKTRDTIEDIDVTCIDNGMPVVLIPAHALHVSGYESCEELSQNEALRQKLESIRLKAGKMMCLGDVTKKVVPKMSIISSPKSGGHINTRTFIPHTCHAAIGVLGAVSVATACLFEKSVVKDVIKLDKKLPRKIVVEHPSGTFEVNLESEKKEDDIVIKSAGIIRTARLLSKGEAFVQKIKAKKG